MSDITCWSYHYINNVIGDFYKNTLSYFGDYLYPRFVYQVLGTYDKAIFEINQAEKFGREINMPQLPALILNPSGDFNLDDANSSAHQLWRFPTLAPGLNMRLYEPIYKDDNVTVSAGFTRLKMDIEFLALLSSFYEYCDLRMMLIQQFGGFERPIYPFWFNSFITIPSDLYLYQYQNEYTGQSYILDWDSTGVSDKLINTTNKTEKVFPTNTRPIFKLMNMVDNSARYGGIDKMADWRLGFTVECQVELPSFLILNADYGLNDIKINIKSGSCYTVNPNTEVESEKVVINTVLGDSTSENIVTSQMYAFKNRYYHIVTSDEADSTSDILITLPEIIVSEDMVELNGQFGELTYGDHYEIVNNGQDLLIKVEYVKLEERQVLEIYVYSTT